MLFVHEFRALFHYYFIIKLINSYNFYLSFSLVFLKR